MAYQNRSLEVMYNGHIITLVVDVSVPSKPEEVPTAVTDGIAYIEGYNVNFKRTRYELFSYSSAE